jgi:LuxR family transcriptional regulator, quorum-sensing system regulator BjaR1
MNSGSHRNLVFDAIDRISRLSSLPPIAPMFRDAVVKWGFMSLGINDLPRPGEEANPIILTESTPPGFRECYIDEHFYLVDHICAWARMAREPFRYSEAPYPRTQAASHQRFMQALNTFGMSKGLIVPLGRFTQMPACVWLAGKDPILDDEAKRSIQLIALFAASMARVLSLPHDTDAGPRELTSREREVLTWAAQGKSAWEIGQILHIAKRTVDEHTQTAMRKLGAANRTHAVVIALRDRMITL